MCEGACQICPKARCLSIVSSIAMVTLALVALLSFAGFADDAFLARIHSNPLHAKCIKGNLDACERMGTLLSASPRKDEQEEGFYYFLFACEGERTSSCALLQDAVSKTGKMEEEEELGAEMQCDLFASAGDCVAAGSGYAHPEGGAPELEKANAKFRRALAIYTRDCQQNQGQACGGVAWVYEHGAGRAVNLKAAIRYASKACKLGDQFSCMTAGDLVHSPASAPYYEKACHADVREACTKFARMGATAGLSAEQVLTLLQRACATSSGDACTDLGNILLHRDPSAISDALAAYERGCQNGSLEGCTKRNQLGALLPRH